MKLQLNFTGIWETVDPVINDFSYTQVFHDKLAPYDNSLRFKSNISANIRHQFLVMGNADVKARLVDDNEENIFTGYLRNTFTITKNLSTNQPVSVELVSPSYRLKRKIKHIIQYRDCYVSNNLFPSASVIHSLLTDYGLSLSQINIPDIKKIIPLITIEADEKTYYELITEILYEFGYVLDFDKDGNFIINELFPTTLPANIANYFDGSNILNELQITKQEETYTSVTVQWDGVKIVDPEIVSSNSEGADEAANIKCKIEIKPEKYFGDNKEGVYIEYEVKDVDLVGAVDCKLEIKKDDAIEIQEFTPYAKRAFTKFYNKDPYYSHYIYKLDVVGKAYEKDGNKNQSKIVTSDTDRSLKIESKYLVDKIQADLLCSNLSNYYKFSDLTYKVQSKTDYALGDYVIISYPGYGTATCRIIQKQFTPSQGKINYLCESIKEYSALDTTFEKAITPKPRRQSPTYLEVKNFHYETRYIRSDVKPDKPTTPNPEGWTLSIPEGIATIWQSGADINFDGSLIGGWYDPIKFSGMDAIYAVLSNEQISIYVDHDTGIADYTDIETEMRIYEGGTETTSLWFFAAMAGTGVTGSITGNKFVVTNMSTDSGWVDIIASRSGRDAITRRFTLTKSVMGSFAAYNLRLSTPAVLVKTDGTCEPSQLTVSATQTINGNVFTPYLGKYKFYLGENLIHETDILESYTISSFQFQNYPSDILFPSDFLLPSTISETGMIMLRIELWNLEDTAVLDRQTMLVLLDAGYTVRDALNATMKELPDRLPKYLGRFEASIPLQFKFGDWFVIYGTTDLPYQRGVYRISAELNPIRISGDTSEDATYFASAMADILYVTARGFGQLTDYGEVTYISNLATNSIFTSAIQIGTANVTGLGSLAEQSEIELANLGSTIIQGGRIKTDLLETEKLFGSQATFSGSLQAANGTFTGSIQSGPLALNISPPTTASFNTNGKHCHSFINELINAGISPGRYACTGTVSATITEFEFSKSAPYVASTDTFESRSTDYQETVVNQGGVNVAVHIWTVTTYTWGRNHTNTDYQIKLYNNGINILTYNGQTAPAENWYLVSSEQEVFVNENPGLPDIADPYDYSIAVDVCNNLPNGNISFTANAFTMKLINLPAYSNDLPAWTVYLQSDGAGNYNLKVKG